MVTELQRFPFLRKRMDEVIGNFLREGLEPSETMITHVIEMEVCWDLAYLIFLKYKCILAPPTAIMLKADAEKYSWVLRLWRYAEIWLIWYFKYKCMLAPPTAIMLKVDAEKYSWMLRLWSLNLVAQYKPIKIMIYALVINTGHCHLSPKMQW